MKTILNFFIFFYFLSLQLLAQENMMAIGNKSISLSYGASNFYRNRFESRMEFRDNQMGANERFNYGSVFTNPFVLQFDYAVSDYTQIGLSLNYFSFALTESYADQVDTIDIEASGFRMAVLLRATRYWLHTPKTAFYYFAGAGIRFRSLTSSATPFERNRANIHQYPLTGFRQYSLLALDFGMGLRTLFYRNVGVSTELGINPGIFQIGLFYRMMPKDRRISRKDNYGW
ncbi:MAG: hypothetical protein IPN26_09990 [Bacteroidetes bacterium]|jgi:hypothetical protein|nr:hypothetical protein [Bacteroidota bacterium]